MAFIYGNDGEKESLDSIFNNANHIANWKARLCKNDVTPSAASVLGDFTEADYSGYAQISITGGWTIPITEGGGKAEIRRVEIEYQHNGGGVDNDIYCVYVVNSTTGKYIGAERLTSPPKAMTPSDPFLTWKPKLTLATE